MGVSRRAGDPRARIDRRKGARYPRTALAERFFAGYAALALALLAASFALAPSRFWPPLAAAAPFGLVALAFDALGRSREVLPEAAGAVGLAGAGWAPWLAPAVFLVLLARSGWGLSSWRRPIPPQALGYQELGYGMVTLVLLAIGYRAGL